MHLKMGYKNLIQIAAAEMDDIWLGEISELYPIDKYPNSMHKVQYDHDTLTSIGLRVQSDMRYKRLDAKLVCQIQNLRLNRRGTRGGKKQQTYHRSINTSNLIYPQTNVAITQDYDHGQQLLSVLNAQSIKNKEILIMDYIIKNRIEACIVTGTWLSDEDDIWISTSDFTKHNYNITVSGRQNRRGGGLALIYKTTQYLQVLKKGMARSFEYAIWKLNVQSTSITIIAVYHPPYSEKILLLMPCSLMT